MPYLNGARGNGFGPEEKSPLGQWLARANARPSVKKAATAAADSLKGMTQVAGAVQSGVFKREYRDHRLFHCCGQMHRACIAANIAC